MCRCVGYVSLSGCHVSYDLPAPLCKLDPVSSRGQMPTGADGVGRKAGRADPIIVQGERHRRGWGAALDRSSAVAEIKISAENAAFLIVIVSC